MQVWVLHRDQQEPSEVCFVHLEGAALCGSDRQIPNEQQNQALLLGVTGTSFAPHSNREGWQ